MLTDGLFKIKHFIPSHDDIPLFLISLEGIFWMCVSKPLPPPPPPRVSAEADKHSNVQIYQEREIERGSE